MPGAIAGFTVLTPNVEASARAYARHLGYRHDGPDHVGESVATAWQAPTLAGARQALLRPASGNRRFIRLVELAGLPDHVPLRNHGWTAIEIVVEDLDRVAADLAASPFRVLGPPETLDLGFTDRIRAMQVAGPSGEVLYLTEIDGPIPGFDLPVAQALVDAAFVAVLGASSLQASRLFYAGLFETAPGTVLEARINCLSAAHGLPSWTKHALSIVTLPDACLVEIDAYPPGATSSSPTSCGLSAPIALVSFDALPGEPAGLLVGPDGERIEILPTRSSPTSS